MENEIVNQQSNIKDSAITETQNQNVIADTQANQQNQDLILGKFKSVNDLAAAYKNIQTQHGQQSQEIGELRKKSEMFDNLQKQFFEKDENVKAAKDYFSKTVPKYNKDEYFKNPEFANLYKEAFNAIGTNLDTDKFVSLLDNYVNSRISMYEKGKSAKAETENLKSQMQFSDSSPKSSPKSLPKIDTIDDDKIDEFVAKYI